MNKTNLLTKLLLLCLMVVGSTSGVWGDETFTFVWTSAGTPGYCYSQEGPTGGALINNNAIYFMSSASSAPAVETISEVKYLNPQKAGFVFSPNSDVKLSMNIGNSNLSRICTIYVDEIVEKVYNAFVGCAGTSTRMPAKILDLCGSDEDKQWWLDNTNKKVIKKSGGNYVAGTDGASIQCLSGEAAPSDSYKVGTRQTGSKGASWSTANTFDDFIVNLDGENDFVFESGKYYRVYTLANNNAGVAMNSFTFIPAAKTYNITLDDNGDYQGNGEATVKVGDTALTISSQAKRTGYMVTGYYAEAGCVTLIADAEGNLQKDKLGFTDEDGKWTLTEGTTLYADWAIGKYTLTIEPNDAEWGSVNVTNITDIDYNTSTSNSSNTFTVGGTTVTATPTAATAEYTYAFSEWTDLPANVTENATVTATFTRTANSYTLAWNANGGDDLTGEYTTGTVAYGTTLTAPNTPTRTDYDFAGWNTANDGTGDAYTGTMPAANTTYYAQWTPSVNYDLPMTTLRPTDATDVDVAIDYQVNDGFTLTSNSTINKSHWKENFLNTLKVSGTVTVTAPANAMLQAIKIYGMSNDKDGATRTVTAGSGATITSVNTTLQARNDEGNLSEVTIDANTPSLANAISFSVSGQSRIYVVVYGLFGISPKKTYTTLTSYYDLDFTDIDGLTAYIIKDDDTSDDAVTVTPINKVSGGVGLVIKATSTDKTYLVPVFTGAADDATGNYMEGSASETTAIAENGGYILKDGKFHPSTAGTLAAGKAYLNIAVTSARALTLNFDDETTTDIKATLKKNEVMNNEVYNLAGQRVAQPQKGLYIMNGKKVVIK